MLIKLNIMETSKIIGWIVFLLSTISGLSVLYYHIIDNNIWRSIRASLILHIFISAMIFSIFLITGEL